MKYKVVYYKSGPVIEKSKSREFEQALSFIEAKVEIVGYYINKAGEIGETSNYEDYCFNILWKSAEDDVA